MRLLTIGWLRVSLLPAMKIFGRRPICFVLTVLAGCAAMNCGGDNPSGGSGGSRSEAGPGGSTSGTGGSAAVMGGGAGGTSAGGATDSGPRGGGGTGGNANDGGPASADLGKACQADTECSGGLVCLKATDNVLLGRGGPANGYCTIACTMNDTRCAPLGGVCFDLRNSATDPTESYCLRSCTFGDMNRAAKCQGRADVGCMVYDIATMAAACFPLCSQDSDCPSSRRCDLQTNQCVDVPATGDPVGAYCVSDLDAGTSSCAGVCLSVGSAATTVASFCAMRCVVGELTACNWVGQGVSLAGGAHGVCALSGANAAQGDVGFCAQECDTANDCLDKTDPGVTCDMSVADVVGHGVCSFFGAASDGGTNDANTARDARDSGIDGRD